MTGVGYFNRHLQAIGHTTATTTYYYHGDQIGSSRLMTSPNGIPVWQATYLPYGEEYNPEITVNNRKFSGKERDTESGLDYFGARYYGSALGRFITPDWAAKATAVPYAEFTDPQSLNLYSYVRNVPTVRVDSNGHCDFCQKVKNSIKGNGWRTDQDVKDDAKSFRNSVGKNDVVGTYDRDSGVAKLYDRDQLDKMSDSQVVQLKDQIDAAQPATQEDLQNVANLTGAILGTFASSAQLQDHFARHGNDFGAKTAAEYEQKASRFLNGPKDQGVLEKVRSNGDVVRYNPSTQEFGVVKPDGTIRTYFKPDPSVHGFPTNMDYYNAQ